MPVATEEKVEYRDFPITDFRALEENEVEGYANVFDVKDAFDTIWEHGVFKKSIRDHGDRIRFLWAHDTHIPLGKLSVTREDQKGLYFRAKVSDTTAGRDIMTLVRDGAVSDVSVGFKPVRVVEDERDPENGPLHILEVDLREISLVSLGAVPGAEIKSFRSNDAEDEDPCGCYGDDAGEAVEDEPAEVRPYPNEHACRLKDPGQFEAGSFRRVSRSHNGKRYSVIMAKPKSGGGMQEQAYRYPKDTWDASDARAHCKSHKGIEFAPATGGATADADVNTLAVYLETVQNILEAIEARAVEEIPTNEQRAQLRQVAERLIGVAKPPRQVGRMVRAKVLAREINQI